MLNAIETYLALRRATGFAMSTAECLLKSFAAFAAERGQTHVVSQTAIDWAALGPTVAQRDARLRAVCRFVRHVQVEDIGHKLPPANHFGARKRRRTPHIYTTDEIGRLIEAALRLRPMGRLRPYTYSTLIALLSATGLRISEALKLTIADVTSDGLLIRETKFRKTRLVPLHDTAVAGLQRYLDRRGPGSDDDPVFIDKRGRPLRYIAVKETFDRLVIKAASPKQRSVARVCTICDTPSRCVRCRPARQDEAGAARIWRRSRPTWVTSTSTRPIGTWRRPPTSCATSPGWRGVPLQREATMCCLQLAKPSPAAPKAHLFPHGRPPALCGSGAGNGQYEATFYRCFRRRTGRPLLHHGKRVRITRLLAAPALPAYRSTGIGCPVRFREGSTERTRYWHLKSAEDFQ